MPYENGYKSDIACINGALACNIVCHFRYVITMMPDVQHIFNNDGIFADIDDRQKRVMSCMEIEKI